MDRIILIRSLKAASIVVGATAADFFLRKDRNGTKLNTENISKFARVIPRQPRIKITALERMEQDGDARYNIYTIQDYSLGMMSQRIITAGHVDNVPSHIVARIIGTQELAIKGIMVMPVSIDKEGAITITLVNYRPKIQKIKQGTRIAKLEFTNLASRKKYHLIQGGTADVSR